MVTPSLANTRLQLIKVFNCCKSFDVESLLFVFFLLSIGRTASFFSQHVLIVIISTISVFSVILLLGAKLSQLCTTTIENKNSKLLRIALTPIFGTGFVYFSWMFTASFSNLAPVVSSSLVLFCILLPPKLHVGQKIRKAASSLIVELKKGRRVHTILFILQLILMISVSNELSINSNNIWLKTIYDGLPLWIYACIFAAFAITIILSLFNSKLWFISILVLSIWVRTFMLSRGFVHFGGDDGENIAVVKFLTGGGTTPFLDLYVDENYWNWRYGSFLTLCFQSNMAFISFLTNLPPDFAAGAMAIGMSTVLLVIGGFALSKAILKSDAISKLALTLMLIFNTSGFWWQFRFDPNLLTHVLFPAYLAVVLLLPTSKMGLFLFFASTVVMASTHPTALALVLPCVIYRLVVFYRETRSRGFITKKKILVSSFLVATVGVVLVVVPNLTFLLLRAFSATHLFGLSSGKGIEIGNFIYKSVLLRHYYPNYTLNFLFVVFGALLLFPLLVIVKDKFTNKIKAFVAIFAMIIAEFLILDFFTSADPFPAWRLWTLIPALFALIISPIFVVEQHRNSLCYHVKIFVKKIVSFSISRDTLQKMIITMSLTTIITLTFVQTAYPIEQALNLDTISQEEYELLSTFTSSVNLNQSLILAESPTWRYILGIIGDWPPTTATYYSRSNNWPALHCHPWGAERLRAFINLVYYGKVEQLLDLATKENVTTVYVVVLNRYAGEKVATWYGGKPYVYHLKSFGNVAFANDAGYILEICLSDYRTLNIPLENFTISATIGITNPILEVEDDTLCIGATFSDRYQAIIATQDFSPINLTEYRFLALQYKGDGHSGPPHLRTFLRDSKNVSVELLPLLFSSDTFTTVVYDLRNIPIKDAVSVSLHVDSGSAATKWPGPGTYLYYIKNLYFATYG